MGIYIFSIDAQEQSYVQINSKQGMERKQISFSKFEL